MLNDFCCNSQLPSDSPESTYGAPLALPLSYGVPKAPPIVKNSLRGRALSPKGLRPKTKTFKQLSNFPGKLQKRVQRRLNLQAQVR